MGRLGDSREGYAEHGSNAEGPEEQPTQGAEKVAHSSAWIKSENSRRVSRETYSGRRVTTLPSRKDIVAPPFRFAPHALNIRENSRACSSSRKVWVVFILDHSQSDEK
jgi:hypothetical protein